MRTLGWLVLITGLFLCLHFSFCEQLSRFNRFLWLHKDSSSSLNFYQNDSVIVKIQNLNFGIMGTFLHFKLFIIFLLCKRAVFAIQKSLFCTVKPIVLHCKSVAFTFQPLFSCSLFLYFPLSDCVKFITSFTWF